MHETLPRHLAALRRRAAVSRGLLIACMLVCASWLSLGVMVLLMGNPELVGLIAVVARLTLLASPPLLLLSVIAVSMWIHKANANLRLIGLDGLRYSPGWAVASTFVPVANLIVPFRAMRELCNRSFGEEAHLAGESVPDVASWWSCHVVASLILTVLVVMAAIELATPIYFTTPPMANGVLIVFALLLLVGEAFFLHRIIGAVTTAQNSVTGVGETFA